MKLFQNETNAELIQRYLNDEMEEFEVLVFKAKLLDDEELAEELELARQLKYIFNFENIDGKINLNRPHHKSDTTTPHGISRQR